MKPSSSTRRGGLLALAAAAAGAIVLTLHRPDDPSAPAATIVTEDRPLDAGVTAVVLDGPIRLTLRQGAAARLQVRAERRLLPNLATGADGGALRIGPRGMLLHPQPIEVFVTLPALAMLRVAGSGSATAGGFAGEQIELALDGSGSLRFDGRYRSARVLSHGSGELAYAGGAAQDTRDIVVESTGSGQTRLSGAARTLRATVRGSGELDARGLDADGATLVQQGSADTTLTVHERVSVDAAGSGTVTVFGKPAERNVRRVGSGAVAFPD